MGFTLNQLEQERQIRKLQKKEDKDTKDYEQLSNLPKINNVELKGDKTTSDLGINADNVMMSDGTTSVEDAVDGVTSELTNTRGEGAVINQGISSIERLFWLRYGNIVLVDIDFIVGPADITANQAELFSGFPHAYSANNTRFRCPKKDGEYQPDLVLCVTEDGKIINQWSNGGIKANSKYACSFAYIATQ